MDENRWLTNEEKREYTTKVCEIEEKNHNDHKIQLTNISLALKRSKTGHENWSS